MTKSRWYAKDMMQASEMSLALLTYVWSNSCIDMSAKKMSQKEAEQTVRDWGFQHIFTWTDCANAHYPPHTHAGLTTHLILAGELTITYPDDVNPQKETFGPGSRLDVDAKRLHEVFVGSSGCTYVIGE